MGEIGDHFRIAAFFGVIEQGNSVRAGMVKCGGGFMEERLDQPRIFQGTAAAKISRRAPLESRNSRMSRRPVWAAAPSAVSQSPLPQSNAAWISVG